MPLVSHASSTGEQHEIRKAVQNRPGMIGACASPNKNRLHTERLPERSKIINIWRQYICLMDFYVKKIMEYGQSAKTEMF